MAAIGSVRVPSWSVTQIWQLQEETHPGRLQEETAIVRRQREGGGDADGASACDGKTDYVCHCPEQIQGIENCLLASLTSDDCVD